MIQPSIFLKLVIVLAKNECSEISAPCELKQLRYFAYFLLFFVILLFYYFVIFCYSCIVIFQVHMTLLDFKLQTFIWGWPQTEKNEIILCYKVCCFCVHDNNSIFHYYLFYCNQDDGGQGPEFSWLWPSVFVQMFGLISELNHLDCGKWGQCEIRVRINKLVHVNICVGFYESLCPNPVYISSESSELLGFFLWFKAIILNKLLWAWYYFWN